MAARDAAVAVKTAAESAAEVRRRLPRRQSQGNLPDSPHSRPAQRALLAAAVSAAPARRQARRLFAATAAVRRWPLSGASRARAKQPEGSPVAVAQPSKDYRWATAVARRKPAFRRPERLVWLTWLPARVCWQRRLRSRQRLVVVAAARKFVPTATRSRGPHRRAAPQSPAHPGEIAVIAAGYSGPSAPPDCGTGDKRRHPAVHTAAWRRWFAGSTAGRSPQLAAGLAARRP